MPELPIMFLYRTLRRSWNLCLRKLFEGKTMYQSPMFLAAFWAGLASPIGLYSVTTSYVPSINGCTPGASFAHVGVSLTQISGSVSDGREFDTAPAGEQPAA